MDIVFNPITRDLEFTEDGDFLTTNNPSTQNGAILLQGRAMNILQPTFGIGFNTQIIGDDANYAANQLNRWVAQVQADGGQASWQRIPAPNADFSFNANVNYV